MPRRFNSSVAMIALSVFRVQAAGDFCVPICVFLNWEHCASGCESKIAVLQIPDAGLRCLYLEQNLVITRLWHVDERLSNAPAMLLTPILRLARQVTISRIGRSSSSHV